MLKTLGGGAFAGVALSGCVGADETLSIPGLGTVERGESAAVGSGTLETFGATDGDAPSAVGVRLTTDAFGQLPTAPSDGRWDAGGIPCCGHETTLDYPDVVESTTNFEWFMLNWNPQGHPPADVYGVPHFDFHFYTMARENRQEIESGTCEDAETAVTCETFTRGMAEPPDAQMPPEYGLVPAVEPGMGNHLFDLQSPELNDGEFSRTFLYGSFDGELIFLEPMITVEYLVTIEGEDRRELRTPDAYPEAGMYPTESVVRFVEDDDAGDAYVVSLESFEEFPGSGG